MAKSAELIKCAMSKATLNQWFKLDQFQLQL